MDKKLLIVLLMVFLAGFVIMELNLTVNMFSWGAGAMITLALIIVLIIVLLWLVKRCDGTPNRSRAAGHDVPSLNNSVFIRNLKVSPIA